MQYKTLSYSSILSEQATPVVAADHEGVVFLINSSFEKEYGWSENDLVGNLMTKFVPPYMRDAHNIGFSRFLVTEKSRILNGEMALPIYCKDGRIRDAMHYITAEKVDRKWRFASLIKPV